MTGADRLVLVSHERSALFRRCHEECPAHCRQHGFCYYVEFGRGPDGRRRQVTKSGYASAGDAAAARAKAVETYRAGQWPTHPSMNVGEWLQRWFAAKITAATLRPTTARCYRQQLHDYLLPRLGSIRLSRLRAANITDPAGNVWKYDYDLRGRKIAADDPDRGHTDYIHDTLSQLATTTDARGQTIAYAYDELGRTTGMFKDSTTGTQLAEWTYDTIKKGLPTTATRIVDGQSYTTRTTDYDDADRPRFTDVVIPATEHELGKTYTFEHDYTLNGKPRSVVLPEAGGLPRERITTIYNTTGLPDQAIGTRGDGNPSNYVSATNYSPYGEPLRISLAEEDSTANVSVGYQYHEATRRLAQLTSFRETSTGYQPVFDLNYTYDQIGNITQITDKPGGTNTDTQCFTYDYLRRLTQAWTPGSHDCTTTPTTAAMGGAAPYWLNRPGSDGDSLVE